VTSLATPKLTHDSSQEFKSRLKVITEDIHKRLDTLHAIPWSGRSVVEQEDSIALLLILAQLPGQNKAFLRYASFAKLAAGPDDSFLFYIAAIAEVRASELYTNYHSKSYYLNNAARLADKARVLEPEAIEPVMLEIVAWNALNVLDKHAVEVEQAIGKFNRDYYSTPNSAATAYTLLGDVASSHERPRDAIKYYEMAWNEIGVMGRFNKWIGSQVEKARLCSKLGRAYQDVSEFEKADGYYAKAREFIEQEVNRDEFLQELDAIAKG
ncbi:MAG: hypothetical protein WCP34_12335, partial [Pseudomonadota bacterium]